MDAVMVDMTVVQTVKSQDETLANPMGKKMVSAMVA